MDEGPLWWPVQRLIDAYRSGSLSPVEVCELAQARIGEVNPTLHACVLDTGELACSQAAAAEAAYRNGSAGPLAGVPISIKDAFHIEGHVTTLGSIAHADDVAEHDSGAVKRLRRAGAVFVGKTNVPEFCQSATTDNLLGPDTANPFDARRTAGGSSGGAAASVASGTCTAALGSDGGGSIRIPASFCGLVGFKPTYGTVGDDGGFRAFSPFILTWYHRRSLEAAEQLDRGVLAAARAAQAHYRERVDRCFDTCDVIATPATATTAFELGCRPRAIAGERVDKLWGAFPFAVPFNVSGHPAVVLPAGFVDGLPAAIQLVGRHGSDDELLSLAEQLETALDVRPFARPAPQR